MFCTKCGRVTELEICSKCNLPIDQGTSVVLDKERPSGWLNFWAFITAPIYLIVSAFRKTRTPRNRSAIESAKKSIYWSLFNLVIIGTHYFLLYNFNVKSYIIDFIYYLLKWPILDPIVTFSVIFAEKSKAMKPHDKNN